MSDIPGRCYGYGRASTQKQADSPEVQKGLIADYARLNGLPHDSITFFIDAAVSGKIPLRERPAGREMCMRLKEGDHVVISRLDRAFRNLLDCCTMMDSWSREGVHLHVANMLGGSLNLSSPMGRFIIQVLAAFAELERAFTSERVKEGLAHRKANKVQHCHYPGYGFKWEQIPGKRKKHLVSDPDEREVMKSIVTWRCEQPPVTWEEIVQHLRRLGITTREGKDWDVNRCKRVHKAELNLQLKERGQFR